MILGKITVKVENFKHRPKFIFCRPVANGSDNDFVPVIGKNQSVYMEKSCLTEHLSVNDTFTCFAIFDKTVSVEEWDASVVKCKIQPITEDVFNELSRLYPQEPHAFQYNTSPLNDGVYDILENVVI